MEMNLDKIASIGAGPRMGPPPPPPEPPAGYPKVDARLDREFPPINDMDLAARQWLRDNPAALVFIHDAAMRCRRKQVKFSFRMFGEVLRFRHLMNDDLSSRFALPNEYTSYFARLWVHWFPDISQRNLVSIKTVRGNSTVKPIVKEEES